MLFSWPPVHAVWPNYEVVMFQPWSVNDTSLGSVTNVNVLSYNPVPPSTIFWIFPLHPPCTDSHSNQTPWYWAAPLFCTQFSTLVPVWDRLTKQAYIPPASTVCPTLAVLPPSTCYPGPCHPLNPRATSPFLLSCPLSGRPPFSDLDIASAPVNPCGLSLLGYILLLSVLKPPPFPPPALTTNYITLNPL